jgi:hypothetical protein
LSNIEFTCIVPNLQFYLYMLAIGLVLDMIYLLASCYTLLWLMIKKLRKLSCLIQSYKKGLKRLHAQKWTEMEAVEDVFGGLNSPDVEILLDLLSEKMGVEIALRIMALTDKEFGTMWKIFLHKGFQRVTSTSIEVTFEAPIIFKYLGVKHRRRLMYVVSLEDSEDSRTVQEAFTHSEHELNNEYANGNGSAIVGIDAAIATIHEGYKPSPQNTFKAIFNDLTPGFNSLLINF